MTTTNQNQIEVVKEVAYVIEAYDHNNDGERFEITFDMLRKSQVGDFWEVNSGGSYRNCVTYMELTVLYKTENIIVCQKYTEGVGDAPNFEEYASTRIVIFELNP